MNAAAEFGEPGWISFFLIPVWISFVKSPIYTKPSGFLFKVCHFSFSPSCASLRCQTLPPSSVSWYNHQRFLSLSFATVFLLLGVFCTFPLGLIIKTFQQIPGESITPKVVASRGKITLLHISLQISLQHCSCHLLTIRLISCGANAVKPFE